MGLATQQLALITLSSPITISVVSIRFLSGFFNPVPVMFKFPRRICVAVCNSFFSLLVNITA